MRLLLGFGCAVLSLLVAVSTPAAPVPKVTAPLADADRLWQRCSYLRLWTAESVCRFLAEPEKAVAFLRTKMPPLLLSKARAKQLIAQLGSEKAATWSAASEELRVLDPRLAMSLTDAWDLATIPVQQSRLACVLAGGEYPGWEQCRIRLQEGMTSGEKSGLIIDRFPGTENTPLPKYTFTGFYRLARTDEEVGNYNENWINYRVGIRLLERINSGEARRVLEDVASGHPDAGPAKAATAALVRLKAGTGKATAARMTFLGRDIRDPVSWHQWQVGENLDAQLDLLFAYLDRPKETTHFLRSLLRPLALDRKRADELLADLFGEDEKKWRAAIREFDVVDIRLAYTPKEVWRKADTDEKKAKATRILVVRDDQHVEDYFLCDIELHEPDVSDDREKYWSIHYTGKAGIPAERFSYKRVPKDSMMRVCADVSEVNTFSDRWNRDAAAVWVLGLIGTPDAVAVVRAVSEGHPKARPTVAAKAVLAHFGK